MCATRSVAVLVLLTAGFALSACGGSKGESSSEWLAKKSDGVYFLDWTREGDSLRGTAQATYYSQCASEGGACTVAPVERRAFTGEVDGQNVRLRFEDNRRANGTLSDDELALRLYGGPVFRFKPSDSQEYDEAAQKLRENAANAEPS